MWSIRRFLMIAKSDIQPISYVKSHAPEILNTVNETHRPIYVTQNGTAKAVIIDPESYDNMTKALAMLKLLTLKEKEYQNKEFTKQADVFSEIEKEKDWTF